MDATNINFTKMHGAGNDFVLVKTDDDNANWPQIAREMCDRHFGIGADGILLLMPSHVANIRMRMFNPDGSESEACGNGLRCLVKYFEDNGLADTRAEEITVETGAGIRQAKVFKSNGTVTRVQSGMGNPVFEAGKIPVKLAGENTAVGPMINYKITLNGRKFPLNLVSMGNPHAIYFTDEPVAGFDMGKYGLKMAEYSDFPRGVNFEVVRILGTGKIEARVWEKGVGETLACGSGACAIAVAARLHGYIDEKVDIELPGGMLNIEWDGSSEVMLSGPAETVFTGKWIR